MKVKIFLLLLFILNGFYFVEAQNSYIKDILKWRENYETELKKDDGWLTLAGLFWLKEGVNTIGKGEKYDVQLTENFAGDKFGEIILQNGKAVLKIEKGVEAFDGGKKVAEAELIPDGDFKENVIKFGSESFYLMKREDKFAIRLKDKNYNLLKEFKGVKWFPINQKYKVSADFEAFSEAKEISIPNNFGAGYKMKSPGILRFKLDGKSYALQPVESGEKLFIIFRDLTSRAETYGLGRFLYAEKPIDRKVILDFNKAENPPCAFTSFATCPIPPQQNRLNIAIRAGEKRYHK